MLKQPDEPVLLSGRYFTVQELHEVQETVRLFPKLSRAELAKTLCENLGWVTPTGQPDGALPVEDREQYLEREASRLPI